MPFPESSRDFRNDTIAFRDGLLRGSILNCIIRGLPSGTTSWAALHPVAKALVKVAKAQIEVSGISVVFLE